MKVLDNTSFPRYPLPSEIKDHIEKDIQLRFKGNSSNGIIGQLYLHPNQAAISIWQKLIPYSPNNIGNWSHTANQPLHITAAIEHNLISKISNLLGTSSNVVGGYMTSGATEGNLYSVWIGRTFLEKTARHKSICMISNDLMHYSILKSADITNIPTFKTAVNINTWNTDITALISNIRQLYREGFTGFLLPLTLGYTVGGTNDNISEIIKRLRVLQKEISIQCFIWIDAAISGFTMPFLQSDFNPFLFSEIQTFVSDFHKVLGVPFPSGLVLYRRNLKKMIEKPIPYLSISDSTVLGSRTGISPVAAWFTIHTYGYKKLKNVMKQQLKKKSYILDHIRRATSQPLRVITDPYSLQAAIIVEKSLPTNICKKHGLRMIMYKILTTNGTKTLKIYPLFFIPMLD